MPKTLLAVVALLVGLLQAWDSHALAAESSLQGLILAAVLLPSATILATRDVRIRGAAVALAALLLTTVRVQSTVPLPELTLAALFPGLLVLFDHAWTVARRPDRSHTGRAS